MKNIIQNIIKNDIDYILKDVSLLYNLNKQELNDLFFYLIKIDGWMIQYVKNPTEEMQLEAVKHINNPTEKVKLEAVKKDGWIIKYIDNQTEEIKLVAVKQNGRSIKYIKDPTEEMKLEAVKNWKNNNNKTKW